jgi:mono/diheme cytochrome c family protein
MMASCVKHHDSPGYEYVPDMYRSQAIEAYVDYGLVGDVEHPELKTKMSARNPVHGSISFRSNKEMAEIFMPFNYAEGEDERIRAGKEVSIPAYYISDTIFAAENVAEGKRLYDFMCTHCHGSKGEGDGKVITVGEYPSTPPAYSSLKEEDGSYKTLGSIFHTITHGKNAMGSHASQLDKDQRWKVAMYVRTLQLGDLKLKELQNQNISPSVSNDTLSVGIVATDLSNDNSN